MVPSQEEPAAPPGTSEALPPGPAQVGEAPLPDPGPSEGPEAAPEKVEVELPEPPEGGWGWLVMLAAMWCNGSVFGIQNACGVLFVSMLKTFGSKDDDKMVFKTGISENHNTTLMTWSHLLTLLIDLYHRRRSQRFKN